MPSMAFPTRLDSNFARSTLQSATLLITSLLANNSPLPPLWYCFLSPLAVAESVLLLRRNDEALVQGSQAE